MISFKSIVKTRYRNHKIESVIESIMNQPDLSRTSTSCGGLYHFVTAEYFSGSSWIDMDWDCITSRINSDWCCQICFGSNARSCTDLNILWCLHSQTLDVGCWPTVNLCRRFNLLWKMLCASVTMSRRSSRSTTLRTESHELAERRTYIIRTRIFLMLDR